MSNEELEKTQAEAVDAQTDAVEADAAPEQSDAPVAADSATDKSVETEDKPVKAKRDSAASGNAASRSKLFKLIYYPVLALVAVIMLVFSIIDGAYGYKPKAYNAEYYAAVNKHIEALASASRSQMSAGGVDKAVDYITDTLVAGGFKLADEKKLGEEIGRAHV